MSAATCTVCGKPGVRGDAFMLGVGMVAVCAECRGKGTVVVAPGDPLGKETKQLYATHFRNLALAYEKRSGFGNNLDVPREVAQARADGLRQAADLLLGGIPQEEKLALLPKPALTRQAPAPNGAAPATTAPAPVRPNPAGKPTPKPTPRMPPPEELETFSKCERALLRAMVLFDRPMPLSAIVLFAGYRQSGGVDQSLASLRRSSFVKGSRNELEATDEGKEALGPIDPLPRGAALIRYWKEELNTATAAVLGAVHDNGGSIEMEHMLLATGYRQSGGVDQAIGNLRKLGILIPRGELKFTEHFKQALKGEGS